MAFHSRSHLQRLSIQGARPCGEDNIHSTTNQLRKHLRVAIRSHWPYSCKHLVSHRQESRLAACRGWQIAQIAKGKEGQNLTERQLNLLLEFVAEPYATMLYTAAYTGPRVSELIGLRWRNVHEESITVDDRCSRGDWGALKSEASNATIAVPHQVIDRSDRLKTLSVEVNGRCWPSKVRCRRFKSVPGHHFQGLYAIRLYAINGGSPHSQTGRPLPPC